MRRGADRTMVPLVKADKCGRMGWTRKVGDSALVWTVAKSEQRWAFGWAIAIVGLTSLPYLLAWWLAPAGTQYTGLLVNHFDGASYFAKMQQGARGDWLFHLAFSPEAHDGTFIFTFYLALGHLAAATRLPIPLVYHLARAAAGLVLLLVGYRFFAHFFERVQTRRAAFLLLGFSAGFGWLLALFGVTTADLWVAEGFTFLSILANPHFPLAIALMLLLFLAMLEVPQGSPRPGAKRLLLAAGLGLLLAVVQPFAVPVVLVVAAAYLALLAASRRRLPWPQTLTAAAAGLGAAPIMVYDLVVYRTNPALAAWSAQNLTPSLPPWDYALGYGLVLLLAIGGLVVAARRRTDGDLFLLAWVGTVALLLYLPFALQRRFIIGLHLPLVALATLGLERVVWPRLRHDQRRAITGLLVALTALTNLFVPAVAVAGVAQGRPPLVMTDDEAAACDWLRANTAWTDTVLAPPGAGPFVPAWAGNRVVYGHPFETIDAAAKEDAVVHFYSAAATAAERRALLQRYGVRYLLVLAPNPGLEAEDLGLTPVWSRGDARLYRVGTGS